MATKFVKTYTAELKDDAGKGRGTLLWGDQCEELDTSGGATKVRARDKEGWVESAALGGTSLLEVYVIDVGQGDGILMKTPDRRWHLIDGGVANEKQMTKKGTANFVRWKFIKDLGRDKVSLENVILTHPDADHFGGLIDVLSGNAGPGRTFDVEVRNLYHSGMGRFLNAPSLGRTEQGEVPPLPEAGTKVARKAKFITELLSGKKSFSDPDRPFTTEFSAWAKLVGSVPKKVARLSLDDGHLPGYTGSGKKPAIRVLGPVLEKLKGGKVGLRELGGESVTRNGHSIVLRVEYGKASIMLTGDLNEASQRLLLSYVPRKDFEVEVFKACHHGSEDIDFDFIDAVKARSTVISSGDNEDYAHPRPVVMGAAGRYGRFAKGAKGEKLPPLLYSTELARSVKLAYAGALKVGKAKPFDADDARVKAEQKGARYRSFDRTPLSTDLIYGLVNVRTDGKTILCATLEEKGDDWDYKVFQAGVDP
jgi:beta-lactamase superfamily II metal-dependent hydrolase